MLILVMFFYIYRLFLICSFFLILLDAKDINLDITPQMILEKSQLYIDKKHQPLNAIKGLFTPYSKSYVIIGEDRSAIWVKLKFVNPTDQTVQRAVVVSDPTLEHISLFDDTQLKAVWVGGTADFLRKHKTLYPYFKLTLEPHQHKTYYLRVYGEYLPVGFTLYLEEEEAYLERQQYEQLLDMFLLGTIFAFMLYGFVHALYLKEKSYFFYGLYLLTLLYSLSSYLGLLHLYAPRWLVMIDLNISISRVYIVQMMIVGFALSFLAIWRYPKIYFVYKILSFLILLGIFFGNAPSSLMLRLVLGLAVLTLLYTLGVALYLYLVQKEKIVRFYLMGFGVVFISYLLMIADSLGYTSVTQHYYNMILWSTVIEALILYLAFADRYSLLEKERQKIQLLLLDEAKKRAEIITSEVTRKTLELNRAVESQKILLAEVHHRVKNNLQIILSIIQMQSEKFNEVVLRQSFVDLENRINAMAKSYELLIVEENLDSIDMQEYIYQLIEDIRISLFYNQRSISINLQIDATLPLKEAIYIGLIINELITNSYKHLISRDGGEISLELQQYKEYYELIVMDSGIGFSPINVKKSLGLTLIYALIEEQLKGQISFNNRPNSCYTIRFKL